MDKIRYDIYKYILNLQNIRLTDDHRMIKSKINKLTKFINNYTLTNPNKVSYLMNMYGGAEALNNLSIDEKMTELTPIFKTFKELDLTEINKNANILSGELDKLIAEINTMDINNYNNINNVEMNNKILNNIDIIKTDVSNIYNVIKTRNKKLTIDVPVDNITEKINYFNLIFNDLYTQLDEFKRQIENDTQKTNEEMNELFNKLNTYKFKVGEKINELDNAIHILDESSKNNIKSFNYEYDRNDVSIVESIETFSNSSDPIIKNIYVNYHRNPKEFVNKYNEYMRQMGGELYFDGRYTIRITNNILMRTPDIKNKLTMIKTLMNDDNFDVEKIYKFPYDKKNIDQIGGNMDDIKNILLYLSTQVNEYSRKIEQYKKNLILYNRLQIQTLIHSMFLTLIITEQLFSSGYVIYKYINRGILTFYKRIVDNIIGKIENNSKDESVMYMKKYHYVTLKKLHIFLQIIIQHLDPKNIIDIDKCKNITSERFLLLNYFKPILEAYREQFQNSITIYSRINDIKNIIQPNNTDIFKKSKMFMSTREKKLFDSTLQETKSDNIETKIENDEKIMLVNKQVCSSLHSDDVEKYKFTEVFDSVDFPTNGEISKYMTLDTQLSNGKGIAIMTYGYSGTGKTYTLFGSSVLNKDGILQSTLDNINGLKNIKFRLFELYGYGLPYPHYWYDSSGNPRINDIHHEIYNYDLKIANDALIYRSVNEIKSRDIPNFIGNVDTYINIEKNMISDVFKNFDNFMENIEKERLTNKRVRETPNNIVSSRSVLIYDFILKIGEKDVPFLIIDLPGREEIVETYINSYFGENKKEILKIYTEGYKSIHSSATETDINNSVDNVKLLLLMSMLNPMGMALFNPDKIIQTINGLNNDIKNRIFDTNLEYEFEISKETLKARTSRNMSDDDINKQFDEIKAKYGITDETEEFKIKISTNLLGEIINRAGGTLSLFFEIIHNRIVIKSNKNKGFGFEKDNNYQYNVLLCIHLINRLILMNKFKILQEIIELLINENLNRYLDKGIEKIYNNNINEIITKLMNENFKSESLSKVNDIEILKKKIKYDYFLTPLEGIYINENIAGLIKYLATKMIKDENDRERFVNDLKKTMLQSDKLTFQNQQKILRTRLSTPESVSDQNLSKFYGFKNESDVPKSIISNINNTEVTFNNQNIIEYYNQLKGSYRSDKLFNFTKPLITDILNPYIEKIDDYKVFYLFGNYYNVDNVSNSNETTTMKCEHQYKLLENTKDFISTIVG